MQNTNIYTKNKEIADKTLEYILLLPEINTKHLSNKEDSELIDEVLTYTYRNGYCNLIETTPNIFGYNPSGITATLESTPQSDRTLSEIKQFDFFGSTILAQCIMSAYDTCVKELTDNKTITAYSLTTLKAEYAKSSSSYCKSKRNPNTFNDFKGLYEAFVKEEISLNPFKIKPLKTEAGRSICSYSTSLLNRIRQREKILNNTITPEQVLENNTKINYYLSDIFHRLAYVDPRAFSKFLNLYDNALSSNIKNEEQKAILSDFYEMFFIFRKTNKNNNAEGITDSIYLEYKFERMFHANIAQKTLQYISDLQNNNVAAPYSSDELNTISQICTLPNVFSRDMYLKYALLFIDSQTEQSIDFFDQIQNPQSVVTGFEAQKFDINIWYMNFIRFCRLYSNLIFPAMEWHFYISLCQACNNNIEKMFRTLGKYIHQNQDYIQHPLHEYNPNLANDHPKIAAISEFKYSNRVPYIPTESKPSEIYQRHNFSTPSISDILSAFKEHASYPKASILPLNKDTFIVETKQNLTKKKIIGTYMNAVVKDIIETK